MFEYLRKVLVQTFIGAIALGYILAQAIMNFAGIFTAPLVGWTTRSLLRGIGPTDKVLPGLPAGISLQAALPEAMMFVVLTLVWYGLVRWLYPSNHQVESPLPNEE